MRLRAAAVPRRQCGCGAGGRPDGRRPARVWPSHRAAGAPAADGGALAAAAAEAYLIEAEPAARRSARRPGPQRQTSKPAAPQPAAPLAPGRPSIARPTTARPAPVARAASSGRAPVNEERLAQLMAQVPHGRPPQGGVINRKARDASKIRAADEVDLSKAQRV